MNAPDTAVHLDAMRAEGSALGHALRDHDMTEIRFRARCLHAIADQLALAPVLMAATMLVECLGPDGTAPAHDYGDALFALSDAIESATRSLR
ncbi:MAG TPA: hypothetical protein VGN46_05420 [Luteibacter sp.]|jgi:hypothetical protein|uniref:hypothetical protein n=1 Tax=Luteibacter sp. TaxID=1886636 RepID=UPI002F423368